jgi:hypothetical protein
MHDTHTELRFLLSVLCNLFLSPATNTQFSNMNCRAERQTNSTTSFLRRSDQNQIPDSLLFNVLKGLKVARRGLFNTAALYIADCILAPKWCSSFQRRHHTKRCGSPLWAKEGTSNLDIASRNFRKCEVFLHAAKLGHGTDYLTSPPEEGRPRIFLCTEKSNGFGRVWIRELGNQRPAC